MSTHNVFLYIVLPFLGVALIVFALGWGWRLGKRPVEIGVAKLGMNLKADILTLLLLLGFSLCVVGVFFVYRDYETRLERLDGELNQVRGQLASIDKFRKTLTDEMERLQGYDLGFRLNFPEAPREDTQIQVYIGGVTEAPRLTPKVDTRVDGNAIWIKLPQRLNRGDRIRVVALEQGRNWDSGAIDIPTIPLQMRRTDAR